MIEFANGELRVISLDQLNFNPVQPAERVTDTAIRYLRDTIMDSKFISPLVVCENRNKKLVVADGHRRLRVARELGLGELACIVVLKDSPEVFFAQLNSGTRNIRGNAWLAIWARSDDRQATQEVMPTVYRRQTLELIEIFGEERLVEIGKMEVYSPNAVMAIVTLEGILGRYKFNVNRRMIGEWVLKHNQQLIIREENSAHMSRKKAEKFFNAVSMDRPHTVVKMRDKKIPPLPEPPSLFGDE